MRTSERAVVVTTIIDRSPAQVWADVRDIESHVDWMHDAVEIRFLSDAREGPGTRFECDTKVGPFSLTDVMEITSWEDERRMGVRHVGLVEGTGEFTLRDLGSDRTEFQWQEDLSFPWFMGGPVGAFLARPVLRFIWKRNLARLKDRDRSSAAIAGIGPAESTAVFTAVVSMISARMIEAATPPAASPADG